MTARQAAARDGARWGRWLARAELLGPASAYAVWWRSEDALLAVAPDVRRHWQLACARARQRERRAQYRAVPL